MFADVVALYRALGRPILGRDYSYVFEDVLDTETKQLAERCERFDGAFGQVDISEEDNGKFRVEVQMPTNDQGRVFRSVSDLLQHSR